MVILQITNLCTFPRGRGGAYFDGRRISAHSISLTPFDPPAPAPIPTSTTTSNGILSCEMIEVFHWFVAQLDPPLVASTSTFSHSSISTFMPNASSSTPSSWVIDLGALHHITGMSSLFFFYHVFK